MNRPLIAATLLAAVSAAVAARAVPLTASDIRWGEPTRFATRVGDRLVVNVPEGEGANELAGLAGVVPAEKIGEAQTLHATVRARGTGIAKPKISYLGLKFQFQIFDAMTGMTLYPNTHTVRHGSFGWTTLDVDVVLGGLQIGQDVTLWLGLQGTTGEVEFDLSSLRIEPGRIFFPRENEDYRCEYSAPWRPILPQLPCRVAGSPQTWGAEGGALRGVMLPGGRDMDEDDFREMARWGVRLCRYQMIRNWNAWKNGPTDTDLAEYDEWINGRLDHLEAVVLPMARKYGMKIVVDVHSPPGGRNKATEMEMFFDARYRDHFVGLWRRIAERFRGNADVIYGYDLVNEPQQLRPAPFDYWTVQRDAALAVREIDPDTPIIVESNGMDAPSAFAYLSPLAISNVIYSVHMYVPSDYTHQGVFGGGPMPYPDPARGRDRDWLRKTLAHVRAFQLRHGARIYVGEFSAVAWAEGADRYIADCISIFEDYGWDWTYHSFRGWNGWSVEHEGPDIAHMKPSADNPRKRALLEGLASGPAVDASDAATRAVEKPPVRGSIVVGAVNCGAFKFPPPDGTDENAVAAEWRRLSETGADFMFFEDVGTGARADGLANVRKKPLDIALKTDWPLKSVDIVRLPDSGESRGKSHRTARCRALRCVVDFEGGELALYGVHLVAEGHIPPEAGSKKGSQTPSQKLRRKQFQALLADATRYDYAVIAGDFNAQTAEEYGFFSERGWTVSNGSTRFGTHATLRDIPADGVVVSPGLDIDWFSAPGAFALDTDHRPVFAGISVRREPVPDSAKFLALPRGERVRLFADRSFRKAMLRENYPDGSGLLSRWIRIEAIPNFRDVGGLVNEDGVELKRGVFYRSARWNETAATPTGKPESEWRQGSPLLTSGGRAALAPLGIRTDLDLRTARECWGLAGSPIGPDVVWTNVSFGHYGDIDKTPEFRAAVKAAFDVLADRDARPLVFHCIGGADRTGTLAFLVQGLCGVDEETLVKDWELTGHYTARLDFVHADCIDRLLAALSRYPGVSVRERIEALLRSCGVSDATMESVRAALLP